MRTKICKIIACLALTASLITTGYGIYTCYVLNSINKITIMYSEIPETFENNIFQRAFMFPNVRLMGCKTKNDVIKILSKDIDSYLEFSIETFGLSGLFVIIAFFSLIIDFFIKKR